MVAKVILFLGLLCILGVQTTETAAPAYCDLPPETGMCKGLFWRYHFDSADGTCKTFVYGGCQGNQNNFKTAEECMKVCSGIAAPTKPVVG